MGWGKSWDRMESRRARSRLCARNRMLRVGYPATLSAELFRDFPEEIELIPVSDKMDHDVEIDVWIPDPYSTQAMRAWPRLHGVKLVLVDDGGNGVDSRNGRAARDHLQCAWRAQHFDRRMDNVGHSGLAEVFSALSRHPAVGRVEAALRGQRALRQITGDTRTLYPPVCGRADRQDGAAGWLRRDRQRDRAHARALPWADARRAHARAQSPKCTR